MYLNTRGSICATGESAATNTYIPRGTYICVYTVRDWYVRTCIKGAFALAYIARVSLMQGEPNGISIIQRTLDHSLCEPTATNNERLQRANTFVYDTFDSKTPSEAKLSKIGD